MYKSTSLKRLLLLPLISICFFGQTNAELCNIEKPIVIDCNTLRYPIFLDEHVEQITVCGLSIGTQYDFTINPRLQNQDCEFQFTTLTPGEIGNGLLDDVQVGKRISFEAMDDCQTLTIVNANCFIEQNYEVVLTLLDNNCRGTDEEEVAGFSARLQPIFVSSSTYTVEQLITQVFIAGGCFEVLNVQGIGDNNGKGNFAEGMSSIGVDSGVILASGNATNATGPNSSEGTTTNFGDSSGDVDLNSIATSSVNDAVGIEFDFIPSLDQVTFNYVFASEEYCEWVGAAFNDVFGFFISGPGINGPYSDGAENIALIPGTGTAVAIGNVNHQQNQDYFNSNSPGCAPSPGPQSPDFIEYDGYTEKFQATATVIPCEVYHIRLVIGDVGDGALDSAVFLEANSFTAGGDAYAEASVPGTLNDEVLYEGCTGSIDFIRWGNDFSTDLDVPFSISTSSTATDGVDATALPFSVTIPAGQWSVSIPITAFEDFITEGTETLIIELTSSCACFNPTLEIEISDLIPIDVNLEDVQICGPGNVSLAPSVSGGVTDYEFLWSDGSTEPTLDFFASASDSYAVTISDACANSIVETVDVMVTPIPSASISGTVVACEEVPNGQLQVDFTGIGPWEFSYTLNGTVIGPITTSLNPYILDINQEGTFDLTAVNVGICDGAVSGSVTVDWLEVEIDAMSTDVQCYEIYDGTLSAIATGAVEPFTYSWTGGYSGTDVFNLGPGMYTVTATDAIGCTEETTLTITQPTQLTASAVETQQIDCNNLFGAADLTFEGGTAGYSFFWDSGSGMEDPDDLWGGDNTVEITDANGCTVQTTVFINEDLDLPNPDAFFSEPLSCMVSSVFLDASSSSGNGPLTYIWYDELGNQIANTAIISVSSPGFYILEITDTSNGCQNFGDFDVPIDNNVPTAIISAPSSLDCNNTSATLDGTGSIAIGNISYQWQNSGGGNIGTNPTVSVSTAGTYTLIITDASNGCTGETTYDLTINENPPIAIISSTDTLGCSGGVATLVGDGSSGVGTITYEWFNNSGTSLGATSSVDVLLAGNYSLVVTDSDNGCTATTAYTVPENTTPPNISVDISNQLDCNEANATLTGDDNGGLYSLQWLDGLGTPIGTGTAEIEVATPGDYTLVVTDGATGCTADASYSITQDIGAPIAEAGPAGTITCDSGAASLSGSGSSIGPNITYAWYNTSGVLVSTDLNTDVSEAGDYTLVVTNSTNGCTAEDITDVVPDVNLPTVGIELPAIINCITSAVDINSSASGMGTLVYQWSNPSGGNAGTTASINVSEPGVYTLVVTNSDNGCSAEASVDVLENMNLPDPIATTADMITCTNTNALLDASSSTVAGGSASYEWFDGTTSIGTNETVNVSTAGTYTLVVTDGENGCTLATTVEVPESMDLPQAIAESDGLLTCDAIMVNLDGTNSSALGDLNYEWFLNNSSISTEESLEVDETGTYTLVVTDIDNGCTNTTTVAVTANLEEPTVIANVDGLLDCVNASSTLSGSGSSGTGTITYEWLNSSNATIGTDVEVDVNAVGTYTLIITNDDNGCTASTTVDVDANSDFPVVDAQVLNQLSCELGDASLTGSTSTPGTFVYSWENAGGTEIGTNQDISVTEPGIYTFIANNTDNGCSSEIDLEVTADLAPPTSEAGSPAFLTCDVTTVTLQGAGSGSNNLTYEWLNPSNVPIGTNTDIAVTESGIYTLIVTNSDNGCTAMDQTTVSPDANLPVASAGNGGELNCLVDDFTLDASGSSALGTISYEWQNVNGMPLSSNVQYATNTAGVYTLLVTDTDNGCTATATVQITENILDPNPVAISSNILDCDNENSTLDASTSTGNGTISYQWVDTNLLPIGSNPMVSVDEPGIYTIEITDTENGCTASTTIEVESNIVNPTISADSDGLLTCINDMVNLSSTANGFGTDFTYSWQFPLGTEIGTSETLETTSNGLYTLIVTDLANGCTNQITTNVLDNYDTPIAVTGNDQSLSCDVTSVTLTGNGSSIGTNIIYEWTNPVGVVVSTDIDASVSSAGDYTLLVTNTESGCTATAISAAIPDSNLPTALANVNESLTCNNSTATLDGTGSSSGQNISYQWLDATSTALSSDLIFDVSIAGTYTFVVTNDDNGCTATFPVDVLEDIETPTSDAGTADLLTCAIDNITLDGANSSATNGTLTYEWFDNIGAPLGTNVSITVDEAGVYELIVTAENGCTNSSSVEVLVDADVPVADAGMDAIIDCNTSAYTLGGSLTSTGATIIYEWQNSASQVLGTSATLDVVDQGVYTLIVTNTASDCSAEQEVIISEDTAEPIADPGIGGMLNCEIMEIELGGGNTSVGADFIYEWTDINGIPISTDITTMTTTAGTFNLLVTNTTNGCTATEGLIIDQNIIDPTADAGTGGTLTCDVNSVSLNGSNSSTGSNYSYEWLNESGTPIGDEITLDVTGTGNYTLIVTDNTNGCTATSMASVIPDAALPIAVAGMGGTLTCSVSDVFLNGNASSTISGNIEYEWTNSLDQVVSNTADLDVTVPDVYTLLVTDPDNGCSVSDAVEVLEDIIEPDVMPGNDQILDCGTTSLALNGSATNGSNFSFEWFDPSGISISNTSDATASTAGTYTLEVINTDNGCMSSATTDVVPDVNLPIAFAGMDDILTCVQDQVTLSAFGSANGSGISYQWLNPAGAVIGNMETVQVSNEGIYTLVVTDTSNDCSSSDDVEVNLDMADPVADIISIGMTSINCDNSSVILTGDQSLPVGDLLFLWSTTDGNISGSTTDGEIEAGAAGTYTLTVTSMTNGCEHTTTYLVEDDFDEPTVVIANPIELTCDITTVDLTGNGSSTGANFVYNWQGPGVSGGNGTLNTSVNLPGIYTLNILNTDNGCESSSQIIVSQDITEPNVVVNVTDMLDCVVEVVSLDGSGTSTGSDFSYIWAGPGVLSGSTTLFPDVNQAGLYTLTVEDANNGCEASATIELEEDDSVLSAVEFFTTEPICEGEVGSIAVLEAVGGQAPYQYSLDGVNFDNSGFYPALAPGDYTLYVEDALGCHFEQGIIIPNEQTVFIDVLPQLTIQLGEDTQIDAIINLPPSAIDTFIWSPTDSLSCVDCLNPIANPQYTTDYTLTVYSTSGCTAIADIRVVVDKERNVYIPTAFSPNNDGINDYFTIFADDLNIKQINEFHVYNRWGEVVFENSKFQPNLELEGWDGSFRGDPMDSAVFVYWLEVEFIDGFIGMYKGDVTLMK